MIDHIVAITIGVLSSIVASLMFLLFLSRLRPKIVISPQIAKGEGLKREMVYRVKVINKTGRSIINIKAQLFLVKPSVRPGGITPTAKEIPIAKGEIMELSKFDLKDKDDNYAFRFRTYEDIKELWDNRQSFLRFKIYGIDSLSGFGKVFTQDYHTKRNSIKEGDFESGNSLEIK